LGRALKFKTCTQNPPFVTSSACTRLPGRGTTAGAEELRDGSMKPCKNRAKHCLAPVRHRRAPRSSCLARLRVLSEFSRVLSSSLRVLSDMSHAPKDLSEVSRAPPEFSQSSLRLLSGHRSPARALPDRPEGGRGTTRPCASETRPPTTVRGALELSRRIPGFSRHFPSPLAFSQTAATERVLGADERSSYVQCTIWAPATPPPLHTGACPGDGAT
jgi:hypothetical protein